MTLTKKQPFQPEINVQSTLACYLGALTFCGHVTSSVTFQLAVVLGIRIKRVFDY